MKSNVSNFLELFEEVYIDASNKCTADVLDLRDLITVRSRVKDQGLSFLTIVLPQFCADLETSADRGFIDPTAFRGFRRTKTGAMPVFLQAMLGQIFDCRTGRLIYDKTPIGAGTFPDDISTVFESVRQICLTFKKVEMPCTPRRVRKSFASFIKIEQELSTFQLPDEHASKFLEVCSVLWNPLLYGITVQECVPQHGPGATAEHISGNQKYAWSKWYDRLEPYFPLIDNGFPLGTEIDSRELKEVTIIPIGHEDPVRVVNVPKTLKAPRIIAIEPCCMQYTQQGIRDTLYEGIENYWLTKGHVNFRDQSINQRIAISSSSDGLFSTIDLSDASDRVPRALALNMFDSNPDLRDAIDACRSTHADVDGEIIPLLKFASMGSALCFPIEAMYFYTICVVALLRAHNLPVSQANCFTVSRDVYVYGDDLVVPSAYANVILDYLQKYNCKVNESKTFIKGNFRESCGLDAYNGIEVTPIYLRKQIPKNRRQVSELISWVATANLFYMKGYWHVATLLYSKVEKILGPLPYVSPECSGLGRVSLLGYRSIERWNTKLHRFETKAWVPSPVYRSDMVDGYAALQKSLLRLNSLSFEKDTLPGVQKRWDFSNGVINSSGLTKDPFGSGRPDFIERLNSVESIFQQPSGLGIPVSFDALHLERTELRGAVALQHHWVASY